jgi:hypothetical protein
MVRHVPVYGLDGACRRSAARVRLAG